MTLGQARGTVYIGQNLGLTASVELEPNEAASALCFDADVFYGDTRLQKGQVKVRSEPLAFGQAAQVRIESSVAVDEPVVTVYLRAGCDQKTTRRYVLLADPAREVAPLALPSAVVTRQLAAASPTSASAITSSGKSVETGTVASKSGKLNSKTVAASPSPSDTRVTATPKVPTRKGPRLQLLPLDLSVELDPSLRFTSELVMGGTEDLQKRAEAAAIWRSLNATAQDITGAQTRQQTMEADIKGLELATTKNRQTLEELTTRLEQAQNERFFNPLVYALVGLVFVTAGLLVWAFRRLRDEEFGDEGRWSDDSDDAAISRAAAAPMVFEGFNLNLKPSGPNAKDSVAAWASSGVDIDIDIDAAPVAKGASIAATRAHGHVDFAHSMTTSLRAVNTKEMLDVRQQAEFFMTLGQHDEAVAMLKESIEHHHESNPLVYLDLLRVLHTLARKPEYDYYRASFNTLFSGRVPDFAGFNEGGRGLEAYPEVCIAIEDRWPKPQALDYIESCLTRPEDDQHAQRFDLEAFRELLLLHGVAQRLGVDSDSGLMPFSATKPVEPSAHSAVKKESRAGDATAPDGLHPVSSVGGNARDLAVDFDLSAPPGNLIEFETTDLLPPVPGTPPDR